MFKFSNLVLPELHTRRFFQHLAVVNAQNVVVAEAPSGIHTQVHNGNWENHARLMAAGSHALRELKSLIEPCEAAGIDMKRARELLTKLEDEQKTYVQEWPVETLEHLDLTPSG